MKMQNVIQAFYIYQKSGKFATNTIENHKSPLAQICEYLDNPELDEISITDIREFMISLTDKGMTEFPSQYFLNVIKPFFRWVEEKVVSFLRHSPYQLFDYCYLKLKADSISIQFTG